MNTTKEARSICTSNVFGALALFATRDLTSLLTHLGIPKVDYIRLRSHDFWAPTERHTIRRAMDALLFGSIDALGMMRFPLAAEYIAAMAALTVSPTNWMTIAAWYHGAQNAEALTADAEIAPIAEGVNAQGLFQLIVQCSAAVDAIRDTEFPERLYFAVRALQQHEIDTAVAPSKPDSATAGAK